MRCCQRIICLQDDPGEETAGGDSLFRRRALELWGKTSENLQIEFSSSNNNDNKCSNYVVPATVLVYGLSG